jgi:hypothetical protein
MEDTIEILIELTETELDEISGSVRIRLFQLFEHGIQDDRDRDWNSHSEYDGLFGQPVRVVQFQLNLKPTTLHDSGAVIRAAVQSTGCSAA